VQKLDTVKSELRDIIFRT